MTPLKLKHISGLEIQASFRAYSSQVVGLETTNALVIAGLAKS